MPIVKRFTVLVRVIYSNCQWLLLPNRDMEEQEWNVEDTLGLLLVLSCSVISLDKKVKCIQPYKAKQLSSQNPEINVQVTPEANDLGHLNCSLKMKSYNKWWRREMIIIKSVLELSLRYLQNIQIKISSSSQVKTPYSSSHWELQEYNL